MVFSLPSDDGMESPLLFMSDFIFDTAVVPGTDELLGTQACPVRWVGFGASRGRVRDRLGDDAVSLERRRL